MSMRAEHLGSTQRVKPSEKVARHREAIKSLVLRFHGSDPLLVGSVARKQDTPDSDVDVLVKFTEEASILDEVGLRLSLSGLLGVEVDVIAADTLHGLRRERMLQDAVQL